jgi:transglutaminase-like putative cysteine protease
MTPPIQFGSSPHLLGITTDPFNSDTATADTINVMQQIVDQYSTNPIVISAVQTAIAGLPQGYSTPYDYARAVFYYVKRRVRLSSDESIIISGLHRTIHPYGDDLLITPDALLSMPFPTGDCDDFSMLTGAMLKAIGIPTKFVTVAANDNEPGVFSHVYLSGYLPQRTAMDASHGPFFGWEYSKVSRLQEW